MKQILILLALYIFSYSILSSQTVYVDLKADGDNDGSSWSNAFLSIHDAIESAPDNGSIWISKGTYTLGSSKESYVISRPIKIFGGFDGNENSLSERDIDANSTVLSGDVLGNDDYNKLMVSKDDNSAHIIVLENSVEDVILDGLTISGGVASSLNDSDGKKNYFNGAGILSLGASFTLKNSTLRENYADSLGGAIFIDSTPGVNLMIENCNFINNKSDREGGAIMVHTDDAKLDIVNSTFEVNESPRGGSIRFRGEGSKLQLSDCEIRNSKASKFGGGLNVNKALELNLENTLVVNNQAFDGGAGLYLYNIRSAIIKNCKFENNVVYGQEAEYGFGGGIHVDSDFGTLYGTNVQIDDTKFEGNVSTNSGGGIGVSLGNLIVKNSVFKNNDSYYGGGISSNYNSYVKVSNSEFIDNTATYAGGAIDAYSEVELKIVECHFSNNTSDDGGAVYCELNNNVTINDTEFESNIATNVAGGLLIRSGGELNVSGAKFLNNSAASSAGAIYAIELGTFVEVVNSEFIGNTGMQNGGALLCFLGAQIMVKQSQFYDNKTAYSGGAIAIHTDSISGLNHVVDACIFDNNEAEGYGGAIVLNNSNTSIINSLFTNNIALLGGTIQPNDSDNQKNIVAITNCTFAQNRSNDTGTIFAWDDSSGDKVNLELLNNIFADSEISFSNEEGVANVESLGGNLCANDSMIDIFNHEKDQNETDPEFKNNRDDFRLLSSSPAINAGVNINAPSKDLEEYDRDKKVDIGAYESQEVTSVLNQIIPVGTITLLPNPVSNILSYRLESDWVGNYTVAVLNISGGLIFKDKKFKSVNSITSRISVANLRPGTYILQVNKTGKQSNIPFIKI